MKKLFSLSFAIFALGFQGAAFADSADDLVETFCEEALASNLESDDEVADMVRSYMAELEEPSMDQIIALSQIAVKIETGSSLRSACDD